jgi:hypothetical protein
MACMIRFNRTMMHSQIIANHKKRKDMALTLISRASAIALSIAFTTTRFTMGISDFQAMLRPKFLDQLQ